jgi:hypothetical protein
MTSPSAPHTERGTAGTIRQASVDIQGSWSGGSDHRVGFQNPCDGMRNARLKREEAFSHAMIIVTSAIVSSS